MTQTPLEDAAEIAVVRGPLAARDGLIRVGTRGSALAVTQTTGVARRIAQATGSEVALVIITTKGDVSTAPLAQLGGTGVFVSALRDALIAGQCDLAVHSLKDLPTGECPGIILGAIPERADARDALCARDGLTLAELPAGARVGTGSPRRAAQILRMRPDLEVCDLRGNVDSRLARVGADLDAVVLAAAGLIRIGRDAAITEYFELDRAPAAPGQGALAVEARSTETSTAIAAGLAALDDAEARACALAERSILAGLEAGCQAPVGAWARCDGDQLVLTGEVYRVDGSEQLTETRTAAWGAQPDDQLAAAQLGVDVAQQLLQGGAIELAPPGTLGVMTLSVQASADTVTETSDSGATR
ncbi:hydroxymethylbilane synthase [Leucobacter exalbidus]|uniref:Porphobilinogen deaminase n=1 Tax=Leucobacter exalbidus TaxID=662960 RepID=A0A940PUF5_9MICO|nr:hydroxymethylbilane synthase [Leucobacter exalbidus]MBP1327028.1 hydroxymethylbilane synthase [Leucobacter exalbidus]